MVDGGALLAEPLISSRALLTGQDDRMDSDQMCQDQNDPLQAE